MSDLTRIEIEVADIGARRVAEQGLTVAAYISLLLRRTFERAPDDESILVYDHVGNAGAHHLDRKPDEDDESFNRRSGLYKDQFGR